VVVSEIEFQIANIYNLSIETYNIYVLSYIHNAFYGDRSNILTYYENRKSYYKLLLNYWIIE